MLPIAIAAFMLGALKLRNITTPEPVTFDVASLVLSAIGSAALVEKAPGGLCFCAGAVMTLCRI